MKNRVQPERPAHSGRGTPVNGAAPRMNCRESVDGLRTPARGASKADGHIVIPLIERGECDS